jgi:hypothetical protein
MILQGDWTDFSLNGKWDKYIPKIRDDLVIKYTINRDKNFI